MGQGLGHFYRIFFPAWPRPGRRSVLRFDAEYLLNATCTLTRTDLQTRKVEGVFL
jgi:hypothetical protein